MCYRMFSLNVLTQQLTCVSAKTGKECISSKDKDKVTQSENVEFYNLLKEINQNNVYAPLKLPAGK